MQRKFVNAQYMIGRRENEEEKYLQRQRIFVHIFAKEFLFFIFREKILASAFRQAKHLQAVGEEREML